MRGLGLDEVDARLAAFHMASDGASAWAPHQLLVEQLQPRMLDSGLLSADELDAWWRLSRDGRSISTSPTMVGCWGRKP
jgi:hypothetical protein